MEESKSFDVKDSFMELEKSLNAQDALKRRQKLKKIILIIGICLIVVALITVLIIVLMPNDEKKGENKEKIDIFDGIIKAKYIINNSNQKIKIINIPKDKLKISVFINNSKIMDLKENETEIILNNTYDNTIELKYQGNITNLFSLFSDIINLEEIDLTDMNTISVKNMEKLFYGCSSLRYVNMSFLKTQNLENMNSMFENCENLETIYMEDFNTKNVQTIL